MNLSVEISNYPLAEEYIKPIQDFIDELNKQANIHVLTNTMSTQIFGEYDDVMQAVQSCMKFSFERFGKMVFVCKFINADLRP